MYQTIGPRNFSKNILKSKVVRKYSNLPSELERKHVANFNKYFQLREMLDTKLPQQKNKLNKSKKWRRLYTPSKKMHWEKIFGFCDSGRSKKFLPTLVDMMG